MTNQLQKLVTFSNPHAIPFLVGLGLGTALGLSCAHIRSSFKHNRSGNAGIFQLEPRRHLDIATELQLDRIEHVMNSINKQLSTGGKGALPLPSGMVMIHGENRQ